MAGGDASWRAVCLATMECTNCRLLGISNLSAVGCTVCRGTGRKFALWGMQEDCLCWCHSSHPGPPTVLHRYSCRDGCSRWQPRKDGMQLCQALGVMGYAFSWDGHLLYLFQVDEQGFVVETEDDWVYWEISPAPLFEDALLAAAEKAFVAAGIQLGE